VSEAPGPERHAAARQQLARLQQAVDSLPARCREIFVLHKFDGRPQKQIAEQFGISLNAVEKHLIRALVRLRQHLD